MRLIHGLPNVMSRNQCETESWKDITSYLSETGTSQEAGISIFYCLLPELATILVPSNFWIKLSNDSRFPELISSLSHKLNTCLCFLWPWNTIFPFAYWQSSHRMSWHTAVCKEPAHTKYSICRTSAPPLGNTRQISRTGKNEYFISSFKKQH